MSEYKEVSFTSEDHRFNPKTATENTNSSSSISQNRVKIQLSKTKGRQESLASEDRFEQTQLPARHRRCQTGCPVYSLIMNTKTQSRGVLPICLS